MLIVKCKLPTFHRGKKCYRCCSMNHVCIKLLYLFPVQYSAKHFLIDTEDDANAMISDEFGYDDQNKDEDEFKYAMKRKRGGENRSPPGVTPPSFIRVTERGTCKYCKPGGACIPCTY